MNLYERCCRLQAHEVEAPAVWKARTLCRDSYATFDQAYYFAPWRGYSPGQSHRHSCESADEGDLL